MRPQPRRKGQRAHQAPRRSRAVGGPRHQGHNHPRHRVSHAATGSGAQACTWHAQHQRSGQLRARRDHPAGNRTTL